MKNPQNLREPAKYIEAMQDTIEAYKRVLKRGSGFKGSDCSLCHQAQQRPQRPPEDSFRGPCPTCPWLVIAGTCCTEASIQYYMAKDPAIIKRRIRQLRNWIKIYQKHL